MPLSHLTLTVSHLPTSTSFFLACLQPLGYQFIGRHDEYIGFGSKADEPADFWLSQERPGTPAGAVHIAFPAPSKEAVHAFFVSALKAGGKIHGEPKTRDHDTGYFSAAIMDFDGNSIEAVYLPDGTARSQIGGPTFETVKNGSVVSRVRSTRTETVQHAKAVYAIEDIPSSQIRSLHEQQQQQQHLSYAAEAQQSGGESTGLSAKAIIGTLLGATAGAAIAYAMVKGDSPSNSQASTPPPAPAAPVTPSQYIPQQQGQLMHMGIPMSMPMLGPAPAVQEPPTYRALEAPPPQAPRSTYTANDAISAYTRSSTSKSPRADTIYEETEYYPPIDGPRSVYSQESSSNYSAVRRSSSGSIYATRDIPIRAIEYPGGSGSQKSRSKSYPCDPSTLISSYADNNSRVQQQQQGHIIGDAETEFSSISTIKPPKTSHRPSVVASSYHSNGTKSSSHHHHSVAQPSVVSSSSHRTKSHVSSGSNKHHHHHHHSGGSTTSRQHVDDTPAYSSTLSSSRSAHKVPLPDSRPTSVASHSLRSTTSKRSSKSHKDSYYAPPPPPHDIPLPASAAPSTVFLDAVDADTAITPDDSISQVGVNNNNNTTADHKSSSGRSHRSKSGSSQQHSHASSKLRASSKFDEPVKPSDSISQVSRASERTVKAAGSKVHSSTHSKSGSRASHH
ncbi:uncharacterized protein TRUGW13939_11239 [Talaromyces rugulosus]|uniref:VOC domain-containing protein n=1 Tax=Talaromyces rugulosus TaxID=121627 RepID=A0A7H8RCQ8_TALRU|nr:uncharacterized protein TRUGW13939_11239 [Talaromyces rugulosus]QKX64066.1 hypothetical protein TRUGW13939_11239 [Talaromyces rugulosus]